MANASAWIRVLLTLFLLPGVLSQCKPRDYGEGSVVCVCDTSHCDFLGPVRPEQPGLVAAYESNKAGKRFDKVTLSFDEPGMPNEAADLVSVVIDSSKKYQSIFGFGGAFTDAAGINLQSLPEELQEDILRSYYSIEGLSYNIGRVPMASCDFSIRLYTYDDVPGDLDMAHFALTTEDLSLKIPYIKRAISMSKEDLWIFGSPWSGPAWMKTSGKLYGAGTLKGSPGGPYYKAWAKYFVLGDADAAKYVQGVAVHWYADEFVGPGVLDKTHDNFPDKFILATEACKGDKPWDKAHVILGSWDRAENYAHDILEDLLHWTTGWVDWNLALDVVGGPNWVKNFVDSPIIVNATGQEFFKQPMYYALAHFSKFLPRGSVRIDSRLAGEQRGKLEFGAFKTPENATVFIVLNTDTQAHNISVRDVSRKDGTFTSSITERSIRSFIWW
ncbi:lysosomal acid glucosylceramidase-like [Ixodes scapularis]